jgi:DNA (cytosine-5)-methyltransferase 1
MRTHLDLFSGIGGFALAASWAGYQTVGFCEIEDYPRRILSKRFPGVPCHRDIRELDGSIYRGVDLITGGYPCQPFSQAGQRKGKEDDRHLWPELRRVVAQARPAFVVAENVAGHITLGLDEVLADLESEGYAGRAIVVPACAVNAPHRRDRVWIIAKSLAHSGSGRRQGGELQAGRNEPGLCGTDVAHSEGNGLQGGRPRDKRSEYSEEVGQRNQESLRNSAGSTEGDVAHSDSQRGCSRDSQRQDAEDAGQSSRSTQHGTGKFVGRLGGSLDGIPEGLDFPRRWGDGSWENGIPRVTVGAKNRTQRLRALGNAIVPQVAYEIIKELERHE